MAKKTSGEVRVKAGRDFITLRLGNHAAQEIECYFDMPILEIIYDKLLGARSRIADVFIIYAALTGRNLNKQAERDEAAEELTTLVGLPRAIEAIHECILTTLNPDGESAEDMTEEVERGQKPKKP